MSNTQIVLDFIDAWNRMDWDAVVAAFSEDVVYHNIPMEELNESLDSSVFTSPAGKKLKKQFICFEYRLILTPTQI